jgi:hypothetical protein
LGAENLKVRTTEICGFTLRKKAKRFPRLNHSLDSDCQSRESMRDLLALSPACYCDESLFQRPVEAIDDFGSLPEKAWQTLNPFEVRNHYTSDITENVRNDENLTPSFKQDLVGFGSSWAVRSLCQNPALQFASVPFINDASNSGGN